MTGLWSSSWASVIKKDKIEVFTKVLGGPSDSFIPVPRGIRWDGRRRNLFRPLFTDHNRFLLQIDNYPRWISADLVTTVHLDRPRKVMLEQSEAEEDQKSSEDCRYRGLPTAKTNSFLVRSAPKRRRNITVILKKDVLNGTTNTPVAYEEWATLQGRSCQSTAVRIPRYESQQQPASVITRNYFRGRDIFLWEGFETLSGLRLRRPGCRSTPVRGLLSTHRFFFGGFHPYPGNIYRRI
ncbi:hypothetical protein J6590_055528 [Homalodisca vitripennis]|nr:hypothetical protein J6590_055528 [Homalodisca vitripennis]